VLIRKSVRAQRVCIGSVVDQWSAPRRRSGGAGCPWSWTPLLGSAGGAGQRSDAAISARCSQSARAANAALRRRSRPAPYSRLPTAATAIITAAATGYTLSIIAMNVSVYRPALTAATGCRSAQLPCEQQDSSPHRGQAWRLTGCAPNAQPSALAAPGAAQRRRRSSPRTRQPGSVATNGLGAPRHGGATHCAACGCLAQRECSSDPAPAPEVDHVADLVDPGVCSLDRLKQGR
jgi:hypothetical protein